MFILNTRCSVHNIMAWLWLSHLSTQEKSICVLLSLSPACGGWNFWKTCFLMTKQINCVMLAIFYGWNVCLNYIEKLKCHPCFKGFSRRYLKISVNNSQSAKIQMCFKSSLTQAPAPSLHHVFIPPYRETESRWALQADSFQYLSHRFIWAACAIPCFTKSS